MEKALKDESSKKKSGGKKSGNAKKTAASGYAKPNGSKSQPFGKMETIMTNGKVNFEKYTNEASKAGKEHMEACVKSGNIFFKGFETIVKTYWDMGQDLAEKNNQAFKELLGCKTLNEYTEVQNKLAQESFDDFMAGATKISELSVKLATDAFQPINDQVSKSIKKATESMAA